MSFHKFLLQFPFSDYLSARYFLHCWFLVDSSLTIDLRSEVDCGLWVFQFCSNYFRVHFPQFFFRVIDLLWCLSWLSILRIVDVPSNIFELCFFNSLSANHFLQLSESSISCGFFHDRLSLDCGLQNHTFPFWIFTTLC